MTYGAHMSPCRREGEDTGSGRGLPGPRAGSSSGPKGFPEVQFHIFIFFSSFLFLFFLFLLYLLQNSFKTSQTTFRNFAEFTARF
jgi:hypothetical protein